MKLFVFIFLLAFISFPPASPAGELLDHEDHGRVKDAGAALDQAATDQLIERLKAQRPDGGERRNLFAVTHFPLGLPGGWSYCNADEEQYPLFVRTDNSTLGPTGYPSLRINFEKTTDLWSPPLDLPWSFLPHTLSFYIKGAAEGTAAVCDALDRDHPLVSQVIDFKDSGWRRIVLTFKPSLTRKAHVLRLRLKGLAWLDAFQLEPGEHAAEYKPQMSCEVALALPKSDVAPAQIQFDDELPLVAYCVTGDLANAELKIKVTAADGTESFPQPLVLKPNLEATKAAPFGIGNVFYFAGYHKAAAAETRPYAPRLGPFRVECWVERRDKVASPVSEIIVNRVRRPVHWREDAPDSPFGIHVQPVWKRMLMAKALGFNWVRLHDTDGNATHWSRLEPDKGKWAFEDGDRAVRLCRQQKLMLLGQLATTPAWASGLPRPIASDMERWLVPMPDNMVDFENYVTVVTSRYQKDIRHWEIWSEPWLERWYHWNEAKAKADPAGDGRSRPENPEREYAMLERAAYAAAKKVNDDLFILGFNSTGNSVYNGTEWTRKILEINGLKYCDGFGYHMFTCGDLGFPGDVVSKDGLRHAAAPLFEKYGKLPVPAWMTEGGSNRDATSEGMYKRTLPYPNNDKYLDVANDECRYILSTLAGGTDKMFLYCMTGDILDGAENPRYLAFVTPDGYPHPSAAAFSNLAWHLEKSKFVKTVELAKGVYAYLFAGGGKSVAVVSSSPGYADYVIPSHEDITVTDLFGNAVPAKTKFNGLLFYLRTTNSARWLEQFLTGASPSSFWDFLF